MSVPDAIAPLIGYRTWAMGLGQLWSPHGPGRQRWPRTEPLRAICLRHGVPSFINPRIPEHAAPDQHCTCGIYATFAPWDLEFDELRHPWALVAGQVEGWGRVALGERGFRAELARPRQLFDELWWDEATRRAAARAARAYGIPFVSWETSPTHSILRG